MPVKLIVGWFTAVEVEVELVVVELLVLLVAEMSLIYAP
jgi:hypothetical protein